MLFNSIQFIFLFVPITLSVYFALNRLRLLDMAKVWLIGASLFFYAAPHFMGEFSYNNFLFLLLGSVALNFSLGSAISNSLYKRKITKKALLIFGIIINLLSIGYFKYTNFFIENINNLLNTNYSLFNVVLPLGISFFTFQQIAYLIDSYQGKTKEYDFLNYTLFVVFFPQLVAGPIVHHGEVIPQFQKLRNKFFNWKNLSEGFWLFLVGLFKKVIIADTLSHSVNLGFGVEGLSFFEGWIVVLCYTFQIYYDFSGYTDMALGLGKMFNINLPENFNNPYCSTSIQEFWRKWHMTLSRFLRDYIYFPLGGSKNKFEYRTYINIMIVFSVCGLWHGASWMFVLWGVIHGLGLCINRLWQKTKIKIPEFIQWLITFLFINITWVFFRAENMQSAINVFKAIFGFNGFYLPQFNKFILFFENPKINFDFELIPALLTILLTFVIFIGKYKPDIKLLTPNKIYIAIAAIILFYSILIIANPTYASPFLYFNF